MNRRQHLGLILGSALAGALMAGAAAPVLAQDNYPSKPVQLIVPFPAGGVVDIVGRKIAEKWKDDFGQPVLIVNKPGANGVVAWQGFNSLPPDGYNIFAPAGQGLGFVHKMNSRITSTFLNDFVPVAAYANYPVVILVNKSLPVNSLKELAAYAARNPKTLSYGTTGVGSGGHFLFELYKSSAKVPDEALPPTHYAGIAPELTALLGNHIQVAIMPLNSLAAQQIEAGAIRALAVSARTSVRPSARRSPRWWRRASPRRPCRTCASWRSRWTTCPGATSCSRPRPRCKAASWCCRMRRAGGWR